ncbi:hypothetical protein VNI00_004648 [Paramarasmius palmivorus]|uniref:CxC2-like cysteine cluster KDZ transposase-associated domain-containing protein n=1 Tax=Paramarasmius palmivorus TaxID=297713 RepID=A0AAW0DKP6_9AGAR
MAEPVLGLNDSTERHHQLLEIGWWPASYKLPQTAATFEALRNFHILNLQGQLPPTDFYRSLEQITDGSGLVELPDRLQQFREMLREWRHIKTRKRFGRGHDPSGLNGTRKGGAMVLCRACPHPGINLPDSWEKTCANMRWIYNLLLATDANFKQKARARANDSRDPPLGPGWGCTLDHEPYLKVMASHASQEEISHCVGFNAIWNANKKKTKGLRATGVGSVTCSRHETFRANGMGDLQVGERYCNMDYILLSSIIGCLAMLIVISYDIACQWGKHFLTRMAAMPEYLHRPSWQQFKFKVPKFHLPAHVEKCFATFAYNFTPGVGLTDGEAPERLWSWLNDIARSLSMMSAGGRWDTMDDCCNFWNWRKMVNLSDSLMRRLVRVLPEAIAHTLAYEAFTEALRAQNPAQLSAWEVEVVAWEEGRSQSCPYEVPTSTMSFTKFKLKLAEEDHQQEVKGLGSPNGLTMNWMILEGLEIEKEQRLITATLGRKALSEYQETTIAKSRTSVLRRIRKLRDAQAVHMPKALSYISTQANVDCNAEDMDLFLPSSFVNPLRSELCPPKVIQLESRTRAVQAFDILIQLQGQLRSRGAVYQYTPRAAPSQGMYRKMNYFKDQVEARVKALELAYNQARDSLLRLRGPGQWEQTFRVLKPEEIRGFGERALQAAEIEELQQSYERAGVSKEAINDVLHGQNVPTASHHRVLNRGESRVPLISWIWYVVWPSDEGDAAPLSHAHDDESVQDIEASLRVEWCKARARAHRAREEVILVQEEMRRALEFCRYQARWWMSQSSCRADIAPELSEGLQAYSYQQAQMELQRAQMWESK